MRIHSGSEKYKVDIKELWENAKLTNINSLNALVFSNENLILHISIHLHKHFKNGFIQLLSFVDVSETINYFYNKIDWNKFIDDSIRYQCLHEIGEIFYISKKYFNANIPENILFELKQNDIVKLENIFSNYIDKNKDGKNLILGTRKEINTVRKLNANSKIKFIFHEFFPNKEFMIKRYRIKNAGVFYLYYIFRFYKGITNGIKALSRKN